MQPAKSTAQNHSVPAFLEEARAIVKELRKRDPSELGQLMKINNSLALDSADRIYTMKFDQHGTPAIETYSGIQYKYMDPLSFTQAEQLFANEHIRIVSGLYGILKPYDSIYEYRLEMMTKLPVENAKDLYCYWGQKLYDCLAKESQVIVNLASKEYSKCIEAYLMPSDRFITCTFKVLHRGTYKVLATAAKMARGQMVSYIVKNKIDSIEGLKTFNLDGYSFDETSSTESNLVFLR